MNSSRQRDCWRGHGRVSALSRSQDSGVLVIPDSCSDQFQLSQFWSVLFDSDYFAPLFAYFLGFHPNWDPLRIWSGCMPPKPVFLERNDAPALF